MENIDTPLSEEVAKQASKKITNLKSKIDEDKDLQNSILRDYTNDARIANKFIKKICIALLVLCFFLVGGLIGTSIYNQHLINKANKEHNQQMLDFITCTDFETTMEIITDNEAVNHGNLTLDK